MALRPEFEAKKSCPESAAAVNFEAECHFAMQLLEKNKYLMETAQKNPNSLKNAIMNVSAIGISLNPALKHAYLVPREGVVILDISYLGLVAVACDSGTIVAAPAELVHGPRGNYQGDTYRWRGRFLPPEHESPEPFHPDRINADNPLENVIGGYCVALLPSQTVIVEQMSIAEMLVIRDSSMAYTKGAVGKKGPWENKWSGRMGLKSIVKRAAHSWPQTGQRIRLDTAIHVLNQHEGLREEDLAGGDQPQRREAAPPRALITQEQSSELRLSLLQAGLDIPEFCRSAGIESLEQLEASRLTGAKQHIHQKAQRRLTQ